jgi:hypothetical protein
MNAFVLIALVAISSSQTDERIHEAEQIFAPVEAQTHAPGIVECSNGDLIASWYADVIITPQSFKDATAGSTRFTVALLPRTRFLPGQRQASRRGPCPKGSSRR